MALSSRLFILSLLLILLPAVCAGLDVSGIVVDDHDTPLAGVKVAAGEAGSAFSQDRLVQTVTDAEGRFTAKDVPDPTEEESLTVEAFMPGWTTDSNPFNPKDPKDIKLKLTKARNITIQLLGLDGKPAAGIKVAQAECKFPSLWGLIIKTDQAGKVTFPVAPESGVYVLCISDSRCVHSEIQIRVPADDGAKFVAVPGGSIEGKLVDHTGKPISGASVSAMADLLGFWGGYGTATSDSSGKFRIDRLDAGDVFLSVKPKPAYAIVPIKCKVVRRKVTQLSTVKAQVPGIIAGRVLDDETGKPVAGIEIQYTPEVWSSGWCGDFTRSDKDGNFKIYGVGAISAVPSLWNNPEYKEGASNVKFERLVMNSGQATPYDIRLKKTPAVGSDPFGDRPLPPLKPVESLRALVLDEQNKPVPGCKLRLFGFDPHKQALMTDEPLVGETDQQGSLTVPAPKGESFVWVASKPGYADAWNGTVSTVSDPVVLRLFKDAPIRGQLVNQEGKAVPNARITAKNVSGYYYTGRDMASIRLDLKQLIGRNPTTVTDEKGAFALAGIPTKLITTLEVSHPQYLQCWQPVTLPASRVKLAAIKTTTVKGRLAATYPSLSGVPLSVTIRWSGKCNGEASAPLRPDGTFEVAGVPAIKTLPAHTRARAALCPGPSRELPEGMKLVTDSLTHPYDSMLEIRKPDGRTVWFAFENIGVDLSGKREIKLPVANLMRIGGAVYGKDGKPASNTYVLYQGPNAGGRQAGNSWLTARTDNEGRWTIYTRAGALKIAVTDGGRFVSTREFKSSFEASKSDIVFDLSKPEKEDSSAASQYVVASIRVVDRRGVAVPRPLIKAEGKDVAGLYNSGSGLDGTVKVGGQKGSLAKITSTFLKKPAYFKLEKTDQWKTIAFDYAQPWVPTAEELKNAGIGFG